MAEPRTGGVERAAVLLMSLGEQSAAAVLRHLDPGEIQKLGAAMAGLRKVSRGQIEDAVSTFLTSVNDDTSLGIENHDYVRRVLTGAVGAERAGSLAEEILESSGTRGVEALRYMSARAVADLVREEHPQLIAVVLAQLDGRQAGAILGMLGPAVRTEVVRRVASLTDLRPSAIAEIEELVQKRGGEATEGRPARLSGLKIAADVLNNVGGGREAEIIEQLGQQDQELCTKIQELMFVFENLLELDDRGVQTLLRDVASDQLVIALKGADPAVQDKIFRNMSQRAGEILKDDIEAKGPVRLSEVETAQKEILATVQRLATEGKIMLRRGGEQFV